MDELPAQWALDEAVRRAEIGCKNWDDVTFCADSRVFQVLAMAARTIEKHEQRPVDQDVLDVRELLRIYCLNTSGQCANGEAIGRGEKDGADAFLNVLSKYRELKARDNG